MNIVVAVLIAMMVLVSYGKYRRDVRSKAKARNHIFDECLTLLEQAKVSHDKANLPVLKGHYGGYQVSFSLVEDTLGWRKLPPLWILIKVAGSKPSHGTLDLIVRPSNNEFYSPSWQWDGNLAIPLNWPQHAIIKYQEEHVNLALLDASVTELFADEKMKELLITPMMVRLTYMINQAERGEYLIMRNAVYEDTPISKNAVEILLNQALAIRLSVESAEIKTT